MLCEAAADALAAVAVDEGWAVLVTEVVAVLDPLLAAATACAAAQDAQSDAAVPVSAASSERNEVI